MEQKESPLVVGDRATAIEDFTRTGGWFGQEVWKWDSFEDRTLIR